MELTACVMCMQYVWRHVFGDWRPVLCTSESLARNLLDFSSTGESSGQKLQQSGNDECREFFPTIFFYDTKINVVNKRGTSQL